MTTIRWTDLTLNEATMHYVAIASDLGIGAILPPKVELDIGRPDHLPYTADPEQTVRRQGDVLSVTYVPVNHNLPEIVLYND